MANSLIISSKIAGLLCIMLLIIACGNGETAPYDQRLYEAYCGNCHASNGKGLAALIPPLAGSDYLFQHTDELACIIRYGMTDTIVVNGKEYTQAMPANEILTSVQIQQISNYILNSWGNQHRRMYVQEIGLQLKECQSEKKK